MFKTSHTNKRLGHITQKALILLSTGASLSLTRRPDRYFRIIGSAAKEWQKINQRSLHEAIKKLYQSKMIDCKDNGDGITLLTISDNGKNRILKYNIENLKIKKPKRWDGLWRIVIFDIPESKKKARDAVSGKLKAIGMMPIQKSVFICPYNCKDEIDFITEIFEITPFVRFITANEIDIALDLKRKFGIIS
ncbi:hypothetical protein A3A18_01795 [Candidatus Azambacteria bacterium RIFCSPLOWO2_01_FULL_44_84]|uniref:Transcriptional repressor PaaX-like central Cas2-like domain-containing protein n=1 Tax=Candidatus Azambacteria bacterium RIFCSPLOWO2_02_FULL_44_14 TaxID=1797306 RepID=A0A1F5CAR7_9BACT|nr:MAG: hypothetical protein A3A18_01795 [Candidatus Azambacteria bacterium RIFCSPLOWO2_01_FULL_44_84]OGD33470.1 MAG: hypothetical protein A3C78_00080 [Candidatus Azambacteria bacterium RIFCSPHIGHO2_02_FULL_45_18]OGD39966.1 MAG: hypothetical protein A3I30_02040 [Candidatus Azambacteria bacterium RIFCSPLOWO2_02_FULL_44_14]OGD52375.1 MAG: hypothetical protein A2608_02515 [Candidatus Azambacteria bacterium RIFOXYD1_FULL_44_10]